MKVNHYPRVKTFLTSTKTNLASNNKARPNHLSVASKEQRGGKFFAEVSRAVRNWAGNGLNPPKPLPQADFPSEAKEEIARLKEQINKLEEARALGRVPSPVDFLEYIKLQEELAVSQSDLIELIKQLQASPEEATRNFAGLQKQFSELGRAYANIQKLYAFSQEKLAEYQETVIAEKGRRFGVEDRLAELLFQVNQQGHLSERSAEVSLNAIHFARDMKMFVEAVLDRQDISPELREAFQQLEATVQNYDTKILNLHSDIGIDDNGNGGTLEDFSQN